MKHFIWRSKLGIGWEARDGDIHKCHLGLWPGVGLIVVKQSPKIHRPTNTRHIPWTSSHLRCDCCTEDVTGSLASPDGTTEPLGKMETRSNCAATSSGHSQRSNILAGHGISSICRRKATMMPPFFCHRTEALGGPQRSTSSRLAALPPARGKKV
jgi:hypothetical protein